ncbi:hypothetical protein Hjap01_02057 [Haloarcula japonica]
MQFLVDLVSFLTNGVKLFTLFVTGTLYYS